MSEELQGVIWSVPDNASGCCRLSGREAGLAPSRWRMMQRIIDAENSERCSDVLGPCRFMRDGSAGPGEERAAGAKVELRTALHWKTAGSPDAALSACGLGKGLQGKKVGVDELAQDKLSFAAEAEAPPNAIAVMRWLTGKAREIGRVFAGFQKYLYQPPV